MEGNNDDEEPQICTVFSSAPSAHSKTIFDTIAFSVPKKENSVLSPTSPFSEDESGPSTSTLVTDEQQQSAQHPEPESLPASSVFESLPMSYVATTNAFQSLPGESFNTTTTASPAPLDASTQSLEPVLEQKLNEECLKLVSKEIDALSLGGLSITDTDDNKEEILNANELFASTPEVPFPVSIPTSFSASSTGNVAPPPFGSKPIDAFSSITFSSKDAAYDAWIPSEQTNKILMTIATSVNSGTYFPEKANMTMPGVIYKEDLVDKVAVNMSRIFGEAEASKRQILTADSVTQDDNGIRELVKVTFYLRIIYYVVLCMWYVLFNHG